MFSSFKPHVRNSYDYMDFIIGNAYTVAAYTVLHVILVLILMSSHCLAYLCASSDWLKKTSYMYVYQRNKT